MLNFNLEVPARMSYFNIDFYFMFVFVDKLIYYS